MTGDVDHRGRAVTLAGLVDPEQVRARFERYVVISTVSPGCLDWTGAAGTSGYGRIRAKSVSGTYVQYAAHRMAWLLAGHTLPPEGLVLRHTCDRPCCVNAAHLLPGTDRENAQDREERGRGNRGGLVGEGHGRARLTAAQVLTLRATAITTAEYARHCGVDPTTAGLARRGQRWQTLPMRGQAGWVHALVTHGLGHLALVKAAA